MRLEAVNGRDERNLRGLEGTGSDVAVLASKVADLAVCRILVVARGCLTANVGVKMGFGAGAVAISRYGLVVNVID